MNKLIVIVAVFLLYTTASFAQDISALYEKLNKSVVVIKVMESKTKGTGVSSDKVSYGALGSGVLIDNKGTILTAAHVVNNADKIKVIFADGQELMAKVTGLSKIADVAKIEILGVIKNPNPAKVGDSDKSRIGDKVMIIGSPMGLEHSLSVGYISRKEKHKSKTSGFSRLEFFQTDAAINTGNSGGPMFNMDGEVIGIVSSIMSRSGGFEGIGFVATINIVKDLLINKHNTWLGMDSQILYGPLALALNVPQGGGVLVENVTENSPAYYMGLKGGSIIVQIGKEELVIGGDIIIQLDDKRLDTPEEILKALDYLNALKVGDKYTFKVLRMGKMIDIVWTVK
ncbi:MAG: trypsin-like peptidase domain-containing protein [Bacteroidales bacterium]|nr:trypsin-like peptidase domain-containing protein [Bacteroidales bacterium]